MGLLLGYLWLPDKREREKCVWKVWVVSFILCAIEA
jgi:hypothetical protein